MRKLFITSVCFLCMISSLSYAQNFRYGFVGGVNLNKPTGTVIPDGIRVGLLLGIKGELAIPAVADGIYADFGLQLSSKGYKYSYGIVNKPDEMSSTTDINYLVIPVHIGYKLKCSESVSLFANIGPYAGVGLWGKAKHYTNGEKDAASTEVFSENGFERFDYGWGVNIGLEYAKHFQLTLGGDWGLKDISKVGTWKYRNRSFTVSLGYLF